MRDPRIRGRLYAVLTSVVCVAVLVGVATVATSTIAPAVAFAQTGHWVVDESAAAVVHVDGGTRQVDARVDLPADVADPLFALQGQTQGFVVSRDSIAVFGRSTLTVDSTIPVEFAEVPDGIETVGGPYLVYREAGTIVRLGVPPLSVPVGGRLDRPVWTDDGTVWVHRPDNGTFCAWRAGAAVLDCSATTAPGEPGALTLTSGDPSFLGTRRDAVEVIESGGLDAPVALGADVPELALVADRDTVGRLAVVEPDTNRLVLTDSGGVPVGRAGGAPIPVELGPGRFTAPVAAGNVIAVLDEATNRLLTFDPTGRRLGSFDLPPGAAPTIVRGGDGQLYVDDADGSATHVVGADGSVTSVRTGTELPELLAVAAPPERRSPVAPPPSGPDIRQVVNGPPRNPVDGPPPVDPPPGAPVGPNRENIAPPVPPLAAPTGVTARLAGDDVVVSWNAVDGGGLAVTYTLRSSGGDEQTTPATTATFTGLEAGQTYTFTVQAAAAARTSRLSAPGGPVTLPIGPPGPPTGLRAELTGPNSGGSTWTVSWEEPDLGGGELAHYLVTRNGTTVQVATTASMLGLANCTVATVQVRAVTRTGPATTQDGPAASVDLGADEDCTIEGQFDAALEGDRTVKFYKRFQGGGDRAGAACRMTFNGDVRWTGTCTLDQYNGAEFASVELEYGTTYDIQLRIDAPTPGSRATVSDTVTITTNPDPGADPVNCVAVVPPPPGCN